MHHAHSLVFFQAEDGIRVGHVTGVQTCALPICRTLIATPPASSSPVRSRAAHRCAWSSSTARSEERRVGKSVDLGGRRIIKKKKKLQMTNNSVRHRKRM